MHLRRLAWLPVAALAACSGSDTTRPNSVPSFTISDGAHRQSINDPNGNPDFFFLPTMVPNPINDPNFNPDDFNPKLSPTVEICNLPGTRESDIGIDTPCRTDAGAYFTSFGATVNVGLQRYSASWTVPVSNDVFYRLRVKVGEVSLGFADVETVSNPSLLRAVNTDQFVGQQDGSSLPIRFRIEIGALCTPAGLRPCDSSTLELANGGTVSISTDNGRTSSGVTLPAQSQSRQRTLTVQKCADGDLNPRVTDLPTFGSCITVKSTPALGAALDNNNPAIVQVCDLAGSFSGAGLYSHAQEDRVTLHRLDGSAIRALPHTAGCAEFTGQLTPGIGSVLAELAHGHFKAAGGTLMALLAPTPLYARRRINLGGGGATAEFSDFQFALPAKMDFYQGNGQTAPYSSTLPTDPGVRVTDLGGDPVARATVHFGTTDGSVGSASFTTAADGIAKTSWTLGAALGSQHMTASGRGIAGGNLDGPRCSFDPFQPIQLSPNPPEFGQGPCTPDGPVGTPVLLQEGTRVFSASAILPFGASGYSYKVVSSNTASPSGWQLSSFNEAANGFVAGAAPFASTGSPCFYVPATTWTARTDILVRRTFTLASAQSIQVRVAVDNNIVAIYLNGVLMSGGPTSHTGCAVPNAADNSVFTGTGAAGTNLITVRAHDQGGTGSFLDVRVSVP
jgi:hypothetical protein